MTSSSFLSTAHAVAKLDAFVGLTDDSLVSAQRLLAAHQRELDLLKAHCAAEIARRSDVALGFSGLARKHGFVNAESFVQSVTGSTKAEATKLVRVGSCSTPHSASRSTAGLSASREPTRSGSDSARCWMPRAPSRG